MKVGSGRIKDSRASWMFLSVSGCVLAFSGGLIDSVGILVAVFVEYFNETNSKIGECIIAACLLFDIH